MTNRELIKVNAKGGSKFPEILHEVDFCVIGGGMAGVCAALSAARHGVSVEAVSQLAKNSRFAL